MNVQLKLSVLLTLMAFTSSIASHDPSPQNFSTPVPLLLLYSVFLLQYITVHSFLSAGKYKYPGILPVSGV